MSSLTTGIDDEYEEDDDDKVSNSLTSYISAGSIGGCGSVAQRPRTPRKN